ncbi:hypothetical protein MKW94_021691 [Papaver nudicaule]|uniref:Vacuolar iron transporter n=1 Tax=Papaver nudicaule TaxID=74823 RepID=A0AA41RX65_PAPNU|nr:hypothetical protein [Papaver nudicaule]
MNSVFYCHQIICSFTNCGGGGGIESGGDGCRDLPTVYNNMDIEAQTIIKEKEDCINYSQRAQWLRPAVLGANDGLVSTASMMMGAGAFDDDLKVMFFAGLIGLIAGACSMALGEYVSVSSQLEIELAQIKRDNVTNKNMEAESVSVKKENLPNPFKAAGASASAFILGAMVPLLAAAAIRDHKVRLGVVAGATSLAMLGFGWLGAVLGKAPLLKSSLRVLVGGWIAMGITFGLSKLSKLMIGWLN